MREREDGAMITEAVETVDLPDDDGAPSVIHDPALNEWFTESFSRFIEWHLIGNEDDDRSGTYGRLIARNIVMALDERLGPLEQQAKQIDELRLQVAQLTGAIDILRGKGLPNGFRVRGTYTSDTVYNHHDVVACDGGSFVALKDQPGPCPGSDWQRLAGPGRRGHRGPRGFDGAPGVDAPRWTGVSFNPEALSFTAKMSDGSLGPTISLASIFASVAVDARSYSVVLSLRDGAELRFSLADLFKRFFEEMGGAQR